MVNRALAFLHVETMLSLANIRAVAEQLSAYRANGNILFDIRDHGNYSEHSWPRTEAMLIRADPTGLALGMMVSEMLESTIAGSKVTLARVLREPGFIEQLQAILNLRVALSAEMAAPAEALRSRLSAGLQIISPDFGELTSRELAICMRDAIYSMEQGLTLRWLECKGDIPMPAHLPLSPDVCQYADIAEFTEALRKSAYGGHLARIGTTYTAIGIHAPGRLAYLSSLTISTHSGKAEEQRAHNGHMAEALDLDTPMERYPVWVTHKRAATGGVTESIVPVGHDNHLMSHLSTLPRDRVIWTALVLEMATQKMAAEAASTPALAEPMLLALPLAEQRTGLPAVVRQAKWQVTPLVLEDMFQSLRLTEWQASFMRPALDGLTADTFLPIAETDTYLHLDTLETGPWLEEFGPMRYSEKMRIKENAVRFTSLSAALVGTQAEVDAVRRAIFGKNLARWVIAWGNRRFKALHDEFMPVFKARLGTRLPKVITSSCVTFHAPGINVPGAASFYAQSTKHMTYNPRCVFDGKSAVTHTVVVVPNTSQDLVEVMGYDNEFQLPAFLQGWQRTGGWATEETSESPADAAHACPYYVPNVRLEFAGRDTRIPGLLVAVIRLNAKNLPTGVAPASVIGCRP